MDAKLGQCTLPGCDSPVYYRGVCKFHLLPIKKDYETTPEPDNKYLRQIKKGVWVDVYDVLEAFDAPNSAIEHAIKKLLAPGKRGAKDTIQDLEEAVKSINRGIEKIKERLD